MQDKYSVTLYVAAPGTPLYEGGTSAAGHVYYVVAIGSERRSYGFAPSAHGTSSGPGKVYDNDEDQYQSPFYERRMEITKAQYDKLVEFGDDPEKHGFNTQYHGATNSCVDFMWGALNHAGIHRTTLLGREDKDFEGGLKPLSNIEFIKSIRAPVKGSDLNTEDENPMPERSLLQRFISDKDLPERERTLLDSIRTQVAGIDRQHGRDYDGTSERVAMGLLVSSKERGLDRVDHVVLGNPPADGSGQRMFAVQGALNDPAHSRASVEIGAAAQTPVEQSFEKLAQMEAPQQQRALATVDEPQQTQRPTALQTG